MKFEGVRTLVRISLNDGGVHEKGCKCFGASSGKMGKLTRFFGDSPRI